MIITWQKFKAKAKPNNNKKQVKRKQIAKQSEPTNVCVYVCWFFFYAFDH